MGNFCTGLPITWNLELGSWNQKGQIVQGTNWPVRGTTPLGSRMEPTRAGNGGLPLKLELRHRSELGAGSVAESACSRRRSLPDGLEPGY